MKYNNSTWPQATFCSCSTSSIWSSSDASSDSSCAAAHTALRFMSNQRGRPRLFAPIPVIASIELEPKLHEAHKHTLTCKAATSFDSNQPHIRARVNAPNADAAHVAINSTKGSWLVRNPSSLPTCFSSWLRLLGKMLNVLLCCAFFAPNLNEYLCRPDRYLAARTTCENGQLQLRPEPGLNLDL